MHFKEALGLNILNTVLYENLTYMYSFEKEPVEVNVESDNDEYTFYIPFSKKRRGYLNLYHKRRAIISYKIGAY